MPFGSVLDSWTPRWLRSPGAAVATTRPEPSRWTVRALAVGAIAAARQEAPASAVTRTSRGLIVVVISGRSLVWLTRPASGRPMPLHIGAPPKSTPKLLPRGSAHHEVGGHRQVGVVADRAQHPVVAVLQVHHARFGLPGLERGRATHLVVSPEDLQVVGERAAVVEGESEAPGALHHDLPRVEAVLL